MAKTDVYGKRTLVRAILKIGSATVNYGFLTAVEGTERQALGLEDATVAMGTLVVGANLPKPTRMMKREGGYSVSSFASTASVTSALAAKWKIQKAGKRYRHTASNALVTGGTKSVCVYVPILIGASTTIKYAWRIPSYQAGKLAASDLTELGIVIPATDTAAADMLFGVNNIKPAKASKTVVVGTGDSEASYTLTMPYDASKTPAGWTPLTGIRIKGAGFEF